MSPLLLELADAVVGAGALAFGGGNQEIVADVGQRAGIPVSGDEAEGFLRQRKGNLGSHQRRSIENRDCIQRGVGHEQTLAVGRLGQSSWIGPGMPLPGNVRRGKVNYSSGGSIDRRHGIDIRQSDVE